jgi:phosphoglycerate dehydrogenase-like enzyme
VCAGVRAAGGGAWAVPVVDGAVPASSLSGFDALILLGVQFTADSVPADGRLSLVARFGVGYDGVDIEACSSAGIICSITPDGVRRPVAVRGLWMNLRVHVLAHGQWGGSSGAGSCRKRAGVYGGSTSEQPHLVHLLPIVDSRDPHTWLRR